MSKAGIAEIRFTQFPNSVEIQLADGVTLMVYAGGQMNWTSNKGRFETSLRCVEGLIQDEVERSKS